MFRYKKRLIGLGAALLCLGLIVGSWAYYTSTSAIENELMTKYYGNRTIENFTPKQEIEPGDTISKEAGVMNTGDYDLVVRVKFTESWARGGADFITHDSSAAAFSTVEREGTGPNYTYTAKQFDFDGTDGAPETDGKVFIDGTGKDDSVMYKTLNTIANATDTGWEYGNDGYWYYNALLGSGQSTGNLLNSLVFADNADIGKYNTAVYYSTVALDDDDLTAAKNAYNAAVAAYAAEQTATNKEKLDAALVALDTAYAWTAEKPGDESTIRHIKADNNISEQYGGYANAEYTLTIITEVCQATTDAINETWTTVAPPAAIRTKWGI